MTFQHLFSVTIVASSLSLLPVGTAISGIVIETSSFMFSLPDSCVTFSIEAVSRGENGLDPNSYRRYEFSTLIGQSPNCSVPIGLASKYLASI